MTAMLVDAARGQVDCGLAWGVMFPGEAGMWSVWIVCSIWPEDRPLRS